jgi:glycosyltransferase involved in cell wall biosynthesis
MMSPPRVIVVSPAAPGVGGLGTAAGDIAAGMTSWGARVSPITLGPRPTLSQLAAANRPLRRFASLSRAADRTAMRRRVPSGWDIAYSMPGFMPRGEDARPRLVHAATHHPRNVRATVAAARRRAGGGTGFMTAAEAELLVDELHRAQVVRAESAAVADELRDDPGLRGQVVLAPPGVDLERFAPAPKAQRLTVAFVGTFSLWKGIDVLVELARRLRGVAEIAAVGGAVDPWSRRLSAGVPFTMQSDVPSLLGRAHALVLPSASDGFGYVVLEAMASGAVPFVTPQVGASELVARLDPRLVQPGDVFAANVSELLATLPLAELGESARLLAREFEQDAMRRQAAALVLGALGVAPPAVAR